MHINATHNLGSFYDMSKNEKQSQGSFEDIYMASILAYENSIAPRASDIAVETFSNDLITKGSLKFIADMNKEKIEKLVEEYRQKLIDAMGEDPEVQSEIESLVALFKKQLMEELQNSIDASEDSKPVTSNAMAQMMLATENKKKS